MSPDDFDRKVETVLGALILIAAVAYALLTSGCGLAKAGSLQTLAAVERRVGGEVKDVHPCLTTLPTRSKIISLAEPEKFAYIDPDNGEARVGMRISADAESVSRLFAYVESLEKIAKKSLGCVVR